MAKTGGIEQPGSKVTLRVSIGPISQDWIAEHVACDPNKMFRDVMRSGPFRHWEHTHKFIPENANSSWLEDVVVYEFPMGALGRPLVAATRVDACSACSSGAIKLLPKYSKPGHPARILFPPDQEHEFARSFRSGTLEKTGKTNRMLVFWVSTFLERKE